ncbi:MAG TPA: hypothetical protein VLB27_01020, partial [candidate division Zixibacteria bacterium]|nr:hypothetical protein [candidate division Zixibacteria bacterium]
MDIRLERFVIAQVAILPPAIILAHGIAALLRVTFAPEAAPAVYSLALVTGLASLLPAVMLYRTDNVRLAGYAAGALGALGGLGVITQVAGSWIPGLGVLIVAPAALYAFNIIARQLPGGFDGALKRTPAKAVLWGLLGLLAIVQSARLSAWISDSNTDWWLCTRHPFFAQHMCMNAYVQAADLNRQGVDNIYDIQYYPGLNPDADPHTTVANITPEDPYQYPPQFLLLPRLAIAVTNDFYLIKVSWFVLQTMFFLLVAWWLAQMVGGP